MTGVGTIVMMALSARSMRPAEYAAFAVWWTMATFLGTSFGVFEAYLARLAITEVTAGRDAKRVTGAIAGRALVVVAVIAAVLFALAPWLSTRLFGGSLGATVVLPIFIFLSATQAIQRGSATGHSRFRAIGGQLATDGIARALLAGVLVATGLDSITTFAVATCVSAGLSLLVGGRMCPQWLGRPRLRGDGVSSRPLVMLLIGSVGPLLVSNGSVPWLASTHAVSPYTLGAFAGAVTLSRLPTQFVAAAFGPLLAQLSHSVEVGDKNAFDRLRRFADAGALLLGVAFVIAFAAIGPWILRAYLGPGYQLSVINLAALATASGLIFVTVVPQASLAALDRWSTIALSWMFGTAAFAGVLLLPVSPLRRAATAPLATVVTALVLMVVLRTVGGSSAKPWADDTLEAPDLTDSPR